MAYLRGCIYNDSAPPRLNAVAASFAVVFIATSIMPGLNYCTIGTRIVQNRVYTALGGAGVEKFPIAITSCGALSMPCRTNAPTGGRRPVVPRRRDDHSAVEPIVTHDGTIYKWELVSDSTDEVVEVEAVITDSGLKPLYPRGCARYATSNAPRGRAFTAIMALMR